LKIGGDKPEKGNQRKKGLKNRLKRPGKKGGNEEGEKKNSSKKRRGGLQ